MSFGKPGASFTAFVPPGAPVPAKSAEDRPQSPAAVESQAEAPAPTSPAPAPSGFSGFKIPQLKDGEWKCSVCDLRNPQSAARCAVCEALKPGAPASIAPPSAAQESEEPADSHDGSHTASKHDASDLSDADSSDGSHLEPDIEPSAESDAEASEETGDAEETGDTKDSECSAEADIQADEEHDSDGYIHISQHISETGDKDDEGSSVVVSEPVESPGAGAADASGDELEASEEANAADSASKPGIDADVPESLKDTEEEHGPAAGADSIDALRPQTPGQADENGTEATINSEHSELPAMPDSGAAEETHKPHNHDLEASPSPEQADDTKTRKLDLPVTPLPTEVEPVRLPVLPEEQGSAEVHGEEEAALSDAPADEETRPEETSRETAADDAADVCGIADLGLGATSPQEPDSERVELDETPHASVPSTAVDATQSRTESSADEIEMLLQGATVEDVVEAALASHNTSASAPESEPEPEPVSAPAQSPLPTRLLPPPSRFSAFAQSSFMPQSQAPPASTTDPKSFFRAGRFGNFGSNGGSSGSGSSALATSQTSSTGLPNAFSASASASTPVFGAKLDRPAFGVASMSSFTAKSQQPLSTAGGFGDFASKGSGFGAWSSAALNPFAAYRDSSGSLDSQQKLGPSAGDAASQASFSGNSDLASRSGSKGQPSAANSGQHSGPSDPIDDLIDEIETDKNKDGHDILYESD
ncbi:hypothetical protein GQ54DRAFT_310466 [Martensiomyces pterosporus]|nr:hypothetical protein GQ54DRAFT_310466 [Martensiomyces pterosporus]